MATFITVEQEGSELLRRNKEQTQANRLNKVEGDEQRRTEQQAREARQQALQQQGRNANGDVQGGGRRRGQFRRDEPAATVIGPPSLLITWNNGLPVFNNAEPKLIYEENNGFPSTITAGGIAQAVALNGDGPWSFFNYAVGYEYRTGVFCPKRKSDFTYEAWMQLAVESRGSSYAKIELYREDESGATVDWTYLDCFYGSGYSQQNINGEIGWIVRRFVNPSADSYSQDSYIPDPVWLQSLQPIHMCIMRKNRAMYYNLNGHLVKTDAEQETLDLNLGDFRNNVISFTLGQLLGNGPSRLGPLRFTPNRARYNPAGFTPDPLPFRP